MKLVDLLPVVWAQFWLLASPAGIVFIVVGLIVLVAKFKPGRKGSRGIVGYRAKPLMTEWERSAFGPLSSQLRPGLHLCPQVRLADILEPDAPYSGVRTAALNSIWSKSVDFVVADISTGRAILVIELDDKTHERRDRKARDIFVNSALEQAQIPVIRFRPRQPINIGPHLTAALAPLSIASMASPLVRPVVPSITPWSSSRS